MRGHLLRIASAVTSRSRVHPVVSSFYARAPSENVAPTEEVVASRRPLVPTSQPNTARLLVRTEHTLEAATAAVPIRDARPLTPVLDKERQARHEVFRPLMPVERSDETPSGTDEGNALAEIAAVTTLGKVEGMGMAVENTVEAGPQEAIASQSTTRISKAPVVVPVTPSERRTIAARQVSPMANVAPGSADEIQIHIGRVEVIAVPPAPQRPLPVPVRKAMSLDDYLRRHQRG
jgi:hypothetical protein